MNLKEPELARSQATTTANQKLPPMSARVGRNEPCPCGSGKKFKKCCAEKADGLPPHPIHSTDQAFTERLSRFGVTRRGQAWMEAAMEDIADGESPGMKLPWYLAGMLYHYGGKDDELPTLFEEFLGSAPSLSPLEKQVVQAQQGARFSSYQILEVRSGEAVLLGDIFFNGQFWVQERSMAKPSMVGRCLLGRVAPVGDDYVLLGTHPWALDLDSAEASLDLIHRMMKARRQKLTPRRLAHSELFLELTTSWEVEFQDALEDSVPSLQTSQGEELCFVTDRYSLKGDSERVADRVRQLEGVEWDDKGVGHWIDEDNHLALGTLRFTPKSLVVECHSLERAERMAAMLSALQIPDWKRPRRQVRDARELLMKALKGDPQFS